MKRWERKRLIYKYILYTNPSYVIHEKLKELPRKSSKTRIKNSCILTGRSKAIYRKFHLSRIMFRELALSGQLPGIRKASW